jgi:hypothetical protein
MSKQLARLLKADIQDTSDLRKIAKELAGKGRGGDTLLAHITPKEVNLLKEAGGAGTVNPDTGLLEFFDIGEYGYGYGADYAAQQPSPPVSSNYQAVAEPVSMPTYAYGSVPQQAAGAGAIPDYSQYATGMADLPFQPPPSAPVDIPAGGVPGLGAEFQTRIGRQDVPPITPVQPSMAQTGKDILSAIGASGKDVGKFLKENPELVKLGLSGAGALFGAQRAKGAAKDIQRSVAEQKAVGAPYQKRGQELIRSAEAGELTPQNAQALQAARAQTMQSVERSGGAGAVQAQAQMEALRQNLLQNQYTYGLQIAQLGDSIALGAIKTGMQLDQNLQQATTNYYTNLAAIAGGITPSTGRQT